MQRHLTALEQRGLIRREERRRQDGGRTSNSYIFTGLIEKARPYAAQMLEERKNRLADRAARKQPKLKLVKS